MPRTESLNTSLNPFYRERETDRQRRVGILLMRWGFFVVCFLFFVFLFLFSLLQNFDWLSYDDYRSCTKILLVEQDVRFRTKTLCVKDQGTNLTSDRTFDGHVSMLPWLCNARPKVSGKLTVLLTAQKAKNKQKVCFFKDPPPTTHHPPHK